MRLFRLRLEQQHPAVRWFRPGTQPRCRRTSSNASSMGLRSAAGDKTAMRRIRSGCCANAPSGHAAAPPTAAMNCRRLMASPRKGGLGYHSRR
jgi:hypothetical protein